MIGTETTLTRLFSLEVTEYELRILFRSLAAALNSTTITIDGPEGNLVKVHHQSSMCNTMMKLLSGE